MVTTLKNEKADHNNVDHENSMELLLKKYCQRCGGLMISEHCFDVESHTGEFEILIRKCLSCGDSIDPTILKNRLQTQQNLENPLPPQKAFIVPSN